MVVMSFLVRRAYLIRPVLDVLLSIARARIHIEPYLENAGNQWRWVRRNVSFEDRFKSWLQLPTDFASRYMSQDMILHQLGSDPTGVVMEYFPWGWNAQGVRIVNIL